jgi:beta-lactamase regulating signal transducer with metallopeptidase domain
VSTLLFVGLGNAVMAAGLAVVAAAVTRIWRAPALAHALWLLVLLKLVTPPLVPVPFSWPQPEIATPREMERRPAEARTDAPAPRRADLGDEVAFLMPAFPPEPVPEEEDPAPGGDPADWAPAPEPAGKQAVVEPTAPAMPAVSWESAVLAVWLSGTAGWFALAAYRLGRFRRLLRHARPASPELQDQARSLALRLGLSHCPAVYLVPGSISPLLWAVAGSGRIILPSALLGRLSADQRATLLAHELAHLRRRDHWVRCLEFVVLGLYWWHPVVWWARVELREAEEQCCDGWVVWALPGAARAYATALVETVDYLADARPALPPVASGVGHFHLVKRRLTMILRGNTRQTLTGAGFLAVVGMGVVLLPLLPTVGRTQTPNERREERQRAEERRAEERRDGGDRRNDDLARAREEVRKMETRLEKMRADLEVQMRAFRRAEVELRRARERLDRMDRGRERFREGADRELRQPRPERVRSRPPREGDDLPRPERNRAPRFAPRGRELAPGGDRLQNLERRLDILIRQVGELRRELRGLRRGGSRPPEPPPRDPRLGGPRPPEPPPPSDRRPAGPERPERPDPSRAPERPHKLGY